MSYAFTLLILAVAASTAVGAPSIRFKKLQLTDQFWAEGAHYGDFNKDGKMDIVSGAFWYAGPDYKQRHEIYPATAGFQRKKADGTTETVAGFEGGQGANNAYSDCFLTYTYDFNRDGWMDVLVYDHPGKGGDWFENPKNKPGHWPRHTAWANVESESPGFTDMTGDGKPEIVCCSAGYLGYAQADWRNPTSTWKFVRISPKGDWQRYTHGIGAGDVNGDGRMDFLEKDGWWEQPAKVEEGVPWKKHPVKLGSGGCQMYAYDVNGDGRNDVITSLVAHEYGLVWFEQLPGGEFRENQILSGKADEKLQGVQFSQVHAIELVDMDGDGLKDILTGKRFWAHGPAGDPEPNAPAVVYWFKLTRPKKGEAHYTPHLVDDNSGVGTQVTPGFVTNRKRPDIVVGNKKGVFLLQNLGR
jgi:hypothetical protein